MVFNLLFILHEWEEGHYPGGFVDLISRLLGKDVPAETKRASRIPTGILLIAFTFVPFFWDDCVVLVLVTAMLGIFEGIVHLMAIRLFRLPHFYSPGMVTAELELLVSVALIVWLERSGLSSATDYIWGIVIMFACFVAMQRTLLWMVGMTYSNLFANIRKQLSAKVKNDDRENFAK